MLIIETILIDVFIISFIYILFIIIGLQLNKKQETQVIYKSPEEKKEEDKSFYIRLLNTSTQEILTFKNKKEFINSIEGYNTIQYFLKGTEEENNKKLVNWYYPGYIIKD